MRILAIILLVLLSRFAGAQTVIKDTTVSAFSGMKSGVYKIVSGKDTFYITKDTSAIITKTVTVVTLCPKVDTLAIQNLKICPVIKQRTAKSIAWDTVNRKLIVVYDDGAQIAL